MLLLLMAVPIGVRTAIYLEEYAHKERWYNRLLELNIQNLAAVPAIVYGILGLAFIVRGPVGIGRVLLAGALILTLVVLPTVIISSREAIRAVPDSIRQGGSRSAPRSGRSSRGSTAGVDPRDCDRLDSRALAGRRGDRAAAPDRRPPVRRLRSDRPRRVHGVPVQIYTWVKLPDPAFQNLAAAAIIVLLVIVLTMNALAIFLRNRYRQTW